MNTKVMAESAGISDPKNFGRKFFSSKKNPKTFGRKKFGTKNFRFFVEKKIVEKINENSKF